MKLLDRLFNPDDKPVSVGSALHFERPTWLVTCVFERREAFGKVSTKARYEVAARTEDEARESVCSFLQQTLQKCCIESVQAMRR